MGRPGGTPAHRPGRARSKLAIWREMPRERPPALLLVAATLIGLAGISGCGAQTRRAKAVTTGGVATARRMSAARQEAVALALRQALPAFARTPTLGDAWPGRTTELGKIRASRRIATLVDPPRQLLSLYLLATRRSGTCLELVGLSGDCNDAPNFFGQAHIQLLELGQVVAGVLDPAVASVGLQTRTRTDPVPLTPDRGLLFLCPTVAGRRSCAGDSLVGFDAGRRQLFSVLL